MLHTSDYEGEECALKLVGRSGGAVFSRFFGLMDKRKTLDSFGENQRKIV